MTQKMIGWKLFNAAPQAENSLPKADYFCVCMMLFSLPVSGMPCNRSHWPFQAYRFCVPLPPCACLQHNQLCLVFSKEFNIMSVIFVTNRPSRRKKSILARVCFTANRG